MLDFLVENTQEGKVMAKDNPTPHERYERENTKRMTFKFNLKTDADILEKLNSVPNKLGYIKSVIRADLAKTYDQKKARADIAESLLVIKRALDGLDI